MSLRLSHPALYFSQINDCRRPFITFIVIDGITASATLDKVFINSYLALIPRPEIASATSIIYCISKRIQRGEMRILCLHGYGTSPHIMKYQMSGLVKLCDPSWEFYYLAGKLNCPLTPGIAPAIPGPYLCYSADLDPASMRAAHALVNDAFESQGPFDGVFGFSQGAAILLAYLLEQIALYPERPLPVKFGIFCSPVPILATDPAYHRSVLGSLSLEDEHRLRSAQDDQLEQLPGPAQVAIKALVGAIDTLEPLTRRSRTSFLDRQPLEVPCVLHPALYKARLPIPTLHVRGRNDPPALKECSLLGESFCLPRWRRNFEHNAKHNFPRSMAELKRMVSAMEWVITRSQQSKL